MNSGLGELRVPSMALRKSRAGGNGEDFAVGQLRPVAACPRHLVSSLGRCTPRGGDELAQIAPAVQVVRQGDQSPTQAGRIGRSERAKRTRPIRRSGRQHKLRPQQQLQAELLRLAMRPHHTRDRTFVGDGQRAVTQSVCPLHQLLRVRGAALEAEVAHAMQLGVGRSGAGD